MIRKVTIHDDFEEYAALLNASFLTVATNFGLTKDNCPTNSAFIDSDKLKSELLPNREFYCLVDNSKPIGFIAIEKSGREEGVFYLEKVAVHPDYRHLGKGKQLMDFALKRIGELGGKKISIGLIDKNKQLKDWYKLQGHKETETKIFAHLPFNVCFMDKYID